AHAHGNSTAPAELNIWMDPEAARIVVNCGRPIRMIPLDATHRALVSLDDCRTLRALGTPAGEAAARFVEKRIAGYDATQPQHRGGARPGALSPRRFLADAGAMAAWLVAACTPTGSPSAGPSSPSPSGTPPPNPSP